MFPVSGKMCPAELKQQVSRLLMYLSFGVKRCEKDQGDLTSLCQKTKTSLFQLWNSLCLLPQIGYAACLTSSIGSFSPLNNKLILYRKRLIENGVLLAWKVHWFRKESSKQPEVEQEKKEKSYGPGWVRERQMSFVY